MCVCLRTANAVLLVLIATLMRHFRWRAVWAWTQNESSGIAVAQASSDPSLNSSENSPSHKAMSVISPSGTSCQIELQWCNFQIGRDQFLLLLRLLKQWFAGIACYFKLWLSKLLVRSLERMLKFLNCIISPVPLGSCFTVPSHTLYFFLQPDALQICISVKYLN